MAARTDWDPARYEGGHSFVWRYGSDLLSILAPKPGERILDLGCGTGHLTAKIAEAGPTVLGIDSSPAMIAQARQNYPKLKFRLADAQRFRTDTPFDAVFSNAALHWMMEPEAVAGSIALALRPGGRFVFEMGGRGNIALIDAALETRIRNYYPSIAEYAAILEAHDLEVVTAVLFDRPTPLENGEHGMREWIATFRADNQRPIEQVEAELRPKLFRDGRWTADYRRLRMTARKVLKAATPEQRR
jgi:trans-aconitate methyltransferase